MTTSDLNYPQVFRVRQHFEAPRLENPAAAVREELQRLQLQRTVQPGQSVAITAGSRGISHIAEILKAVVDHFHELGARPFLVPAMGSHGGGTAEGQIGVLHEYGITEEYCGCPIRASMETVVVCQAKEGFPVHFDRYASEADHVVVCGRIKPHTNFTGEIESGLMKMMLIGLGKHAGALVYHAAILDFDFGTIVRSVGREVLARCNILAGLAIVENGYDETARIEAVPPEEFETREKELLTLARRLLPRLPFERADILILDEIGKEISGSGMDTNVVGRKQTEQQAGENEYPKIKRIVVRGLSQATKGNAAGIGIAQFCRTKVLQQMDVKKTRVNCLTAGRPTGAMIPLDYATDREVLNAALPTLGLVTPENSRILWIKNTLHLAEVECSAAYYEEAKLRDDLEILAQPRPLPFDGEGNLVSQW